MIPFLLSLMLAAGDEPKPKIVLAPEVQSVVDLARSAAPEVFADTTVRLVQAGRIPQREAQIELLEQAFAVAADAVEPIRLIALPSTPPDTRELYLRSTHGHAPIRWWPTPPRITRSQPPSRSRRFRQKKKSKRPRFSS
jgi:hypothetical protein